MPAKRKKATKRTGKTPAKRRGRIENLKPWPKGVSGNPKGSSRKQRLLPLLLEQLDREWDRDPQKRSAAEVVMEALIKQGIKGNVTAIREILDRADGAVDQGVGVNLRGILAQLPKKTLRELEAAFEGAEE